VCSTGRELNTKHPKTYQELIMNVKYCEKCLLFEHKYNHQQLYKFSEDELKEFPLDYLIENSEPIELLYAWHKLPLE
jgi:late competence protein required for DNA uptake (superfamily II DNA/RNA helicase)